MGAPATGLPASVTVAVSVWVVSAGSWLVAVGGVRASAAGVGGSSVGSLLGPDVGNPAPEVVVSDTSVRVNRLALLQAAMRAPQATVTLGSNATVHGGFCAKKAAVGVHGYLECAAP